MRPRKKDRHLPPCVYLRHGAYWLVKRGKWTRLASDLPAALAEYARLHAQPSGGMAALIEEALPNITRGKAKNTISHYTTAARRLQEMLAEFSPGQVTQRDITQIKRAFSDSPAVANRTLIVLRLVFDYALEQELIDMNPCIGIKRAPQQARTRRLTRAEFKAIQNHADPVLAVVMDICYLTGQRIGDVLAIKRSDLLEEGIYFEQQKTGARLTVSWTPELVIAVETAKSHQGTVQSMYLFKGKNGEHLQYGTLWKRWRKSCADAGVKDANIHDLRAMSGTEAEAQGINPQKLLGHTDEKMTKRYLRDRIVPVVSGPSFGQSNTRTRKRQ